MVKLNKSATRCVIVLAAMMAFAGVFWYVWSPFSAVARLERALLDDDRIVIRELVDFPSVRDSAVESILSKEIASKSAATIAFSWNSRREEVAAQIKAYMNPAAWSARTRKSAFESFRSSNLKVVMSEADDARRNALKEARARTLQSMEHGNYSGILLTAGDGNSSCCAPVVVRGFILYYQSPNVFVVSDRIRKRIFRRHGLFSWHMVERIRHKN